MKPQTRNTFWLVSGLLLITVVLAGVELVVAQPTSETSRPALDTSEATFELLGEHKFVNIDNIAYTSDEGRIFNIYLTCSSVRG
jgi:hypothetical protein